MAKRRVFERPLKKLKVKHMLELAACSTTGQPPLVSMVVPRDAFDRSDHVRVYVYPRVATT